MGIDKDKARKLLDRLKEREEEEVELDEELGEIETIGASEEDELEPGAQVIEEEEDDEEEGDEEEGDEEADLEDDDLGLGDLDLDLDEFEDEDDEEDDEEGDDEEVESETDVEMYKDALADLMNNFNAKNEKTPYNMFIYQPTEEHFKSFKVGFDTDDTMIYFDNDLYSEGKVDLVFNDIFYGELDELAKAAGVRRIEWKDNEDGKFATITI